MYGFWVDILQVRMVRCRLVGFRESAYTNLRLSRWYEPLLPVTPMRTVGMNCVKSEGVS